MAWRFTLIDRDNNETIIDDPLGWDDITVNIKRDRDWHGIFFDYTVQQLEYHGHGATLIKQEYEAYGMNGEMFLRIEFECSDGEAYEQFYFGKLRFPDYKDTCGDECIVTIGLEESNDIMLMRNNYEQTVNINSNVAFDETTILDDYNFLNTDLLIPSRGIPLTSTGSNDELQSFNLLDYPTWGNISPNGTTGSESGAFLPIFVINTNSEIENTQINGAPYYDTSVNFNAGSNSIGVPPFIDLIGSDILKCGVENFRMQYRVKGRFIDTTFASRIVAIDLIVMIGSDPATTTIISNQEIPGYAVGDPRITEFDLTFDQIIPINTGQKLYFFFTIQYIKTSSAPINNAEIQFDPESFITFTAISICEDTEVKVYYINEVISRTVEAITNNQIKFYSTFFGRSNSQPYALPSETCGGAEAITNGLNLRRRLLTDNTQPDFFVTLKGLYDGLRAIWNIGLTIEPDNNRPGFNRLRFEDWRFFYQNDIGGYFNLATNIERAVDSARLYNKLEIGYNKWEAEEYTGLYEFMNKREYRIAVNSITNTLTMRTDIITGTYPIEITRRQDSGSDDWRYDNDIFLFCLKFLNGEYSIETFLDSAYGIENIPDSETCYNGRISPARNAMRWFNFIMQGLRTITNDSKLIFTKGDANYKAEFGLNNCQIEGAPLSESQNIALSTFDDPEQARPIIFPETISFDHPLNYNYFLKLKNDSTLRYKSFGVNCNGNYFFGWIDDISYDPNAGQANIKMIPKNNTQLPDIIPPEGCQATIVTGSVTMNNFDFTATTAEIDFTEGAPGATFWYYIITQGNTPGAGDGFSGTTNVHPFTVAGITPGQWSVFIVPYCDDNDVGQNYGAGTFDMPFPPFSIEISAHLTGPGGSQNHVILTAQSIGNVPAQTNVEFNWGHCVVNTSIPFEYCASYPGSPDPTPTNSFLLPIGQANASQQSIKLTPGSNFGYITKIVIFNIVGISQSQITKAAGQAWTLEFQ